jgi:subfamily B ATP-binding cassette protein HlyB/CyaB
VAKTTHHQSDHTSTQSKPVRDTGLQALVILANFHGIAADGAQLSHELAMGTDAATEHDILRAGRLLRLKTRVVTASWRDLAKLPLPAIAVMRDEIFVVIARVDERGVLMLPPEGGAPVLMSAEQFQRQWTGRVVVCTQRFWKDTQRTFGLRWFIPTILKYKKPLLEVLIAACALQIIGLATPILTQVVIDKALVHHSTSTLDVMIIALVAVAIFETLMGMTRSYIFTHTSNRIDVILGARLFRHLFALPLRYFETRRIGDTTARVLELEKIRQFLTGTPLTTAIDVVFMSVYIAVMCWYSMTLTWVALAALPCFIILSSVVTPLFRRRLDEKFTAGADSQSYLVESVSGAQTIKSFALEPLLQKRWEDRLATYTQANFRTSLLSANARCGRSAYPEVIRPGDFVVRSTFGDVWRPNDWWANRISHAVWSCEWPGAATGAVLARFSADGYFYEAFGGIFLLRRQSRGSIPRNRVCQLYGVMCGLKMCGFRYRPDCAEAIRDLSFGVRPGAVVGVVGRSGSGKSTISNYYSDCISPKQARF